VKFSRFEPGTDKLRISRIEGAVNGDEGHKRKAKG
jgi:hypothetical protein